jgi:Adenylosuccinate lyase
LDVELLACEALERTGEVPRGVAARARKKARIDVNRIAEIEQVVKHDVIAFWNHWPTWWDPKRDFSIRA